MSTNDKKVIVGISLGDINGIGPEVVIKTMLEPEIMDICTPVIFSSQKTMAYYRNVVGEQDFNFQAIKDFTQLHTKKPNVFVCYEEEVQIEMGKSTPIGGKYALKSLEVATKSLLAKQIDVLVTAPINKNNIQSEHFKFIGHTEYLESQVQGGKSLMLMCSEQLRVALVSGHVPVSHIAAKITKEKVVEKLRILNQSLKQDFAIDKPKIAVLGLNPHAGDNGTLGREELEIIAPAIKDVEKEMFVMGPYAADGFFAAGTYKKFDAVLAMYHDQGLIPFKTIAFEDGVNFTAGLPFVRTSPDHGTAYDIAGKGKADPASFKQALYAAIDIYKRRKNYAELTAHPLKITDRKTER
jgi:4-hydroxythreonine-4-phosphate dehydrogenase